MIPIFNKSLDDPDWRYWQHYYLDHPEDYPSSGMVEEMRELGELEEQEEQGEQGELGEQEEQGENFLNHQSLITNRKSYTLIYFTGIFQRRADQDYMIILSEPESLMGQSWMLITVQPDVNQQLQHYPDQQQLQGWGRLNPAGNWLLVNSLQ
jgi:hypothetical protein